MCKNRTQNHFTDIKTASDPKGNNKAKILFGDERNGA